MVPPVAFDEVRYPPRCAPGDRVALVSASAGLPGLFPHVHELGVRRLSEIYGLVPVEYGTTRTMGSPPAARAADLMSAFTDPSIRAIMATIGGDDQISVLRHLDREIIAANPKPFFGYSDNTNLLNYLCRLGIVAYHGGSTMVHLGRSVAMHPVTLASLRAALFDGGEYELRPVERFAVNSLPWNDPANLGRHAPTHRASPWSWHGTAGVVEARLWGGCLEVLDWTFQVGRYVGTNDYYRDTVLFIETSELMPSAEYVYRTMRNLGERGVLEVLAGLIVARPASEPLGRFLDDSSIDTFEHDQRDAVLRALDAYHAHLPTLIGVEAGHTDPQQVLPIGGLVHLDGRTQRLFVTY